MDSGPHPSGKRPSPSLTPIGVVEAELAALSRGDVETCYNFASPNKKFIAGPRQKFDLIVRHSPAYAPLVHLRRYSIVAALPVSESVYQCRVRVWPGDSSKLRCLAPVLDYDFQLKRESESSIDYTTAGCWMVENVRPDAAPRDIWEEEVSRLSDTSKE
jgi:hypothetical protein